MSIDKAKALINAAQVQLTQALKELEPDIPPTKPPISTAAEFDAALAAAKPGDILLLSTSLVYSAPLALKTPITLQSESYLSSKGTRAYLNEPAPMFMGGVDASGDDIRLLGIGIRHTVPTTDILKVSGLRPLIDHVNILGDPVKGAKRGIAYFGTDGQILNSYVDDIFQPAQDTQAICSWDMGPGLVIDNCYLCAAGQSVMFGGGDPANTSRVPRGVRLTHSTLTKKPAWVTLVSPGKHVEQVKCALELKDVIDFYASDCVFEYAGTSQGQGAYLFVFTPRNQNGAAPFSTVQNVVIENSVGRFAAGIANMLGTDNINPSGPLTNVTLRNLSFTDIDPRGITGGTGRLFMFDRKPQTVTLDKISVAGNSIAALGYFVGAVQALTMTNLTPLPPSKYGWKVDAGGSGVAALKTLMPDAVLDETIV